MGLMRFYVPSDQTLPDDFANRIYFVGPDQVPWRSHVERTSDTEWSLSRDGDDSGQLFAPWNVAGRGELTLGTATLIERESPYLLAVELARGRMNRIRNLTAEWSHGGLQIPAELRDRIRAALAAFAVAATRQDDAEAASRQAASVVEDSIGIAQRLAECYVQHAADIRQANGQPLDSLLGVNLSHEPPQRPWEKKLRTAFNAAWVPLNWMHVEAEESEADWSAYDKQMAWCRKAGMRVCGGPLLQMDHRGLPDWLCLWEGEFDNLLPIVGDYVKSAVERYQGKVHLWHAASRINGRNILSLSEEDKLRLVVHAIDVIRQTDSETPVIVSFDQPWGEYLSRVESDLSPLHIADALVRSGLGISAIGLEWNVGYHPLGTATYDVLEVSQKIDLWTLLGLPLIISITVPNSTAKDEQSRQASKPMIRSDGAHPDPQLAWLRSNLPLIASKPAVRGIVWNQVRDAAAHDYPNGGLFDAEDQEKPSLGYIREFRDQFLD